MRIAKFTKALLKYGSLILGLSAYGYAAECNFTFNLDDTHTAVIFNNQTHGCYFWAVNYFTSGYSAVSVTFELAPNGINSSVPGTFTTFTGFPVALTGDQAQGAVGLSSWVRIRKVSSTGSGTISGQIVGAPLGGTDVIAMGTAGSSVGPPLPIRVDILGALLPSGNNFTAANGASLTQWVPSSNNGGITQPSFYNSFPYSYNGSTMDLNYVCPLSAPITFTAASGTLQIVGLTASQIIRVCHVSLASDTTTNITLSYGTGSNCGTGNTALTGAYNGIKTLALDFGPEAALRTASANAFCVGSSAAATIGGVVSYAKF
jgi:hypothetical protein